MNVWVTRTLELLLFPPAINFLLVMLGFVLLLCKWRKTATSLIAFSLVTLYLASTPAIAYVFMGILQQLHPALTAADMQCNNATATPAPAVQGRAQAKGSTSAAMGRQGAAAVHGCTSAAMAGCQGAAMQSCPAAIVILGGGRKSSAPEYSGADTVSKFTLERLRYGAWLQRRTGLPVLVSGGSPLSENIPEAHLMKAVLENDFRVPVQWVEDKSHTTFENATFSQALLAQANIQHIYLVTHAWHMPRSVDVFKQAGLTITPAPTAFATPSLLEKGGYAWIPAARALEVSNLALHEMAGRVWYGLRN